MALPPTNKRPSQRTQIVARRVPDPGRFANPAAAGAGFGAIAQAFSSFSGTMEVQEEKDEMEADSQALSLLALSVNQRPAAAGEAIRSGDYSEFVGTVRQGRRNFASQAPLVVASALGARSASEFNKNLDSAPMNQSPGALAGEFLKQRMDGLPPKAALVFQEEFQKGTAKSIAARQNYMADIAAVNMKNSFVETLEDKLEAGTITTAGIAAAVNSAANAGGNNVKNLIELRAASDEAIARLSASGDPHVQAQANVLLYADDASQEGTVASRLGEAKVEALQNEQAKSYYKFLNMEARNAVTGTMTRLAAWKAGKGSPGDNPASLLNEFDSRMEGLGLSQNNPEVAKTRMQLYAAHESRVVGNDVLTSRGSDLYGLKPSAIDKAMEGAKEGLYDSHVMEAIAYNGATPKIKSMLGNALMIGSPEELAKARALLRTVMGQGGRGLSSFLENENQQAVFIATMNAPVQDALAIRESLQDALQANDGSYKGALYDSGVVPESENTSKRAAEVYMSKKVLADPAKLKALGFPPGVSYDTLDAGLKQHLTKVINIAALAARAGSTGVTEASVIDSSLLMFKDDMEAGLVSKDGVKWRARRTPELVIGLDGRIKPGGSITEDHLKRFSALTKAAGISNLGLTTDSTTARDGTMQVTLDQGYGDQPFSIPAGREVLVPKSLLGDLGVGGNFVHTEHTNDPNMVVLKAPVPAGPEGHVLKIMADGTDISVSELRFDPKSNSWDLRRSVGPDVAAIRKGDAGALIAAKGVTKSDAQEFNDYVAQVKDNIFMGVPQSVLIKRHEEALSDLQTASPENREEVARELQQVAEALKAAEGAAERAKLPEKAVDALKSLVKAGDPSTLTEDELKAKLKQLDDAGKYTTPEAIMLEKALIERQAGIKELTPQSKLPDQPIVGTSLSAENFTAEERETLTRLKRKSTAEDIQAGVNNGTYHYSAIGATRGMSNLQKAQERADQVSKLNGHNSDTMLEAGKMTSFMRNTVDFIEVSEGFVATPSKDPGADQLNIGFGFSLGRDDAEEALEAAGTTMKAVMGGKPITEDQASIISSYAVAKQETWIRKSLKGVPLKKHQKKALHSFFYSSNWRNGSPTVWGPNIEAALRAGEWEKVANQIRSTTKVSDPNANIEQSMRNRRNREALMFLGR